MIEAGQTFKRSHGDHLWIVISKPDSATGRMVVACVSLTTDAHWKDQTCILDAGDHSFVRHRTVVGYDRAELRDVNALTRAMSSGQIIGDDDLSESLLLKIQRGALTSKRTPNEVKDLLRSQGITP